MKAEIFPRPIFVIAYDIAKSWKNWMGSPAQPYLLALMKLIRKDDDFGADKASSIILYFLSNAQGFRGGDAKVLKQELKSHLD